jgi:hypothetical protein
MPKTVHVRRPYRPQSDETNDFLSTEIFPFSSLPPFKQGFELRHDSRGRILNRSVAGSNKLYEDQLLKKETAKSPNAK